MKKMYKNVVGFIVLLSLLMNTFVITFARDMPINFDWGLPTAISAGLDSYQLELLSDDEIRLLHQPYIDITHAISFELDVIITPGTLDCYFVTREDILYLISNLSFGLSTPI